MIFIVVKFDVRPEHSDQWLSLTEEFTNATRAEPGNIMFEWSVSAGNPNQFVLVEAFQDGAAEAHVNSDHFAKAMSWMPDCIARTPSIINVQTPGVGWGEMAELQPR